MDFFFSGVAKDTMLAPKPRTFERVKSSVIDAFAGIDNNELRDGVILSFPARLQSYISVEGGRFE
jgi:hypothetical protein